MVKHIVAWKLRDVLLEDEAKSAKLTIKEGFESLRGQIPGATNLRVHIDAIAESSNADILLYSTFASKEALHACLVNPLLLAVENTKVHPYVSKRVCIDFEE